jgi:histone arginine demethylase JMJD6
MSQAAERNNIGQADFAANFLVPRLPLILRRFALEWPAVQKWTPAYLATQLGDVQVPVQDSAVEHDAGSPATRSPEHVSLAAYVRDLEAGADSHTLPYIRNVFLSEYCPALLEDVRVPGIAQPNWLLHPSLAPSLRAEWLNWFELFISPPATRFPHVHVDRDHTHAWLLQVCGRKKVWMWPNEAGSTRKPEALEVSSSDVLDTFFPGYEPTIGIIEPGDLVFIPEGWWPTAESQSTSITLSGNWVEQSNWEAFFDSHFLDQEDLPEGVHAVLRRLRSLVADHYLSDGVPGSGPDSVIG